MDGNLGDIFTHSQFSPSLGCSYRTDIVRKLRKRVLSTSNLTNKDRNPLSQRNRETSLTRRNTALTWPGRVYVLPVVSDSTLRQSVSLKTAAITSAASEQTDTESSHAGSNKKRARRTEASPTRQQKDLNSLAAEQV